MYLIAFIFFTLFSYFYLRTGVLIKSRGYILIGVASFLVGCMFLLFIFRIYFIPIFIGAVGFLIGQFGFGIILTKERALDRLFLKNTNIFQRITGNIPPQIMKELEKVQTAPQAKDKKGVIFVGIFSMIAAVLIFLWKKEYGYPLLLFISGIIFILMGRDMRKTAK